MGGVNATNERSNTIYKRQGVEPVWRTLGSSFQYLMHAVEPVPIIGGQARQVSARLYHEA